MMEVKFARSQVSCLDTPVQEVQNSEQTQEIKIPDGMPDVGRIVGAWGQPILRGKEWRSDSVSFSGGLMVWVLYDPEDGSQAKCLDVWIPFQMRWDLPENTPEGKIRVQCLIRFVDARSVSPRKILVRAGMSALMEVFVPREAEVAVPEEIPEDVELLRSTYPARLAREAGEKSFQMEEDITLPDAAHRPEKLVYYRVQPRVSDKKVLTGKVVFRGSCQVHILYAGEDGQLYSWDGELPFSQYAELEQEHGPEGQADVALCVTNLELEPEEQGHLLLKCGLTAQYLITDKVLLELTEDAYSPGRTLELCREPLAVTAMLENRQETLYAEQTIPAEVAFAADVCFLPEFPRLRRQGSTVEVEMPGVFQVLYYGEDGHLYAGTARWEGQNTLPADESCRMTAIPGSGETQAAVGNGQIMVKAEVPLEMTTTAVQEMPMVTGLELGQARVPDPGRPSLILCRAGEGGLWQLAKESGSTMEAIRSANNLVKEPEPNQLLLIPVP